MAPETSPPPGVLLLRGSLQTGYELVDPATQVQVASGLPSLDEVVVAARQHGATGIWHLPVDDRGRWVGEPFRLAVRAAAES